MYPVNFTAHFYEPSLQLDAVIRAQIDPSLGYVLATFNTNIVLHQKDLQAMPTTFNNPHSVFQHSVKSSIIIRAFGCFSINCLTPGFVWSNNICWNDNIMRFGLILCFFDMCTCSHHNTVKGLYVRSISQGFLKQDIFQMKILFKVGKDLHVSSDL